MDGGEELPSDQDAKVRWWIQYELAARKIQRQFRCWNGSRHFRRSYARKLLGEQQISNKKTTHEESFINIISEEASFEDKMCFWRGAIELRRAHKARSTDLCVRSFIDAAGEMNRAVVQLGTKDYCVLNKADISSKLRRVFLPRLNSSQKHSDYQLLMMSSLRKSLDIEQYGRLSCPEDFANIAQNRVNMIRSLRNQKNGGKTVYFEPDPALRKKELFNILNSVVQRAYFSKHHGATKEAAKMQRIPGESTTKSKLVLTQNQEEIRYGSLDYLSTRTPLARSPMRKAIH